MINGGLGGGEVVPPSAAPGGVVVSVVAGSGISVDSTDPANPIVSSTSSGAVTSVFGRTGIVVAASGDYTVAQVTGAAPLASPAFTGVPTAPTAAPGTNTTQAATTAFVTAAIAAAPGAVTSVFGRTGIVVAASGDYTVAQVTGAAPLASPAFTGVPTAPTAAPGTNTTQAATTAFAAALAGSDQLTGDVTAGPGAGSQAATVVRIQGVAVTSQEATLVAQLNGAQTRTATGTLTAGEETVFTGSTATQTLTLPASPQVSSINTVLNLASVSVTVAAGAGNTLNNQGTVGSIVLAANQYIQMVFIGTVWYVFSTNTKASALTTAEVFLPSSNVSILTTATNIESLSLAAGTWLVTGRATVTGLGSAAVDLWLGPTTASATGAYAATSASGGSVGDLVVTKIITLASTTTVFLIAQGSATGAVATVGSVNTGIGNATGISAIKVA